MRNFNPLPLQRDILRTLAGAYNVKGHSAKETFNEMWKIYRHARDFAKASKRRREQEVEESYKRLGKLVRSERVTAFGHSQAKRVLLRDGPFVVFSDHHMAPKGHPNAFFHRSGNATLYRRILSEYAHAGYTLVENGDVEELVILDLSPKEAAQFWKTLKKAKNYTMRDLRACGYLDLRRRKRLETMRAILATYASVYRDIRRLFHDQGRLIRLAGNHDQDLQTPAFSKILRTKYPGIRVYDYLFLTSAARPGRTARSRGSAGIAYVIGHGHQLDTSTTPRFAPLVGEAYSECISWAFQGPDRIWKWNDDGRRWLVRGVGFENRLVTDKAGSLGNAALNDVLQVLGQVLGNRTRKRGVDDSTMQAAMEGLTGHNIAWEYFESRTSLGAVVDEVATGQEFFKFRHMNELRLQSLYPKHVRSNGRTPMLVLGHTHEVRHQAVGKGKAHADFYLNSGAAGRFENVLWATEIEEQEARVVAWHADEAGRPRRQEFRPRGDKLFASDVKPVPLTGDHTTSRVIRARIRSE